MAQSFRESNSINFYHIACNDPTQVLKLQATNKKAPSKVEVTEICAMSLVSLATATGRKLWLKWPDLVDQMYSTLKPVIVSNECGLCE